MDRTNFAVLIEYNALFTIYEHAGVPIKGRPEFDAPRHFQSTIQPLREMMESHRGGHEDTIFVRPFNQTPAASESDLVARNPSGGKRKSPDADGIESPPQKRPKAMLNVSAPRQERKGTKAGTGTKRKPKLKKESTKIEEQLEVQEVARAASEPAQKRKRTPASEAQTDEVVEEAEEDGPQKPRKMAKVRSQSAPAIDGKSAPNAAIIASKTASTQSAKKQVRFALPEVPVPDLQQDEDLDPEDNKPAWIHNPPPALQMPPAKPSSEMLQSSWKLWDAYNTSSTSYDEEKLKEVQQAAAVVFDQFRPPMGQLVQWQQTVTEEGLRVDELDSFREYFATHEGAARQDLLRAYDEIHRIDEKELLRCFWEVNKPKRPSTNEEQQQTTASGEHGNEDNVLDVHEPERLAGSVREQIDGKGESQLEDDRDREAL